MKTQLQEELNLGDKVLLSHIQTRTIVHEVGEVVDIIHGPSGDRCVVQIARALNRFDAPAKRTVQNVVSTISNDMYEQLTKSKKE